MSLQLHFFCLSPIGYENEQGEVEMRPAFEEDLNRITMPFEEKQKWRYRFKRMREKLERDKRNLRKSKYWWTIPIDKIREGYDARFRCADRREKGRCT